MRNTLHKITNKYLFIIGCVNKQQCKFLSFDSDLIVETVALNTEVHCRTPFNKGASLHFKPQCPVTFCFLFNY